jgi:signal transduction histidine kinase
MQSGRSFTAVLAVATVGLLALSWQGDTELPEVSSFLFWVALLWSAELLPVALGFGTQVTMAFPLLLASAILFDPPVAMLLSAAGSFDIREFRREIPLWRSVFNRSQVMLSTGSAALVIHFYGGDPFEFPGGTLAIALAAVVFVALNLGLVGMMLHVDRKLPIREAFQLLVPRPAMGFMLAQAILAALGAGTAAVYERIGPFVAVFLIPLMFARLSILGARAQQELSEKVRKQQEALLEATEQVFQERENERHRIAEEIHDGSLQLLAAAAYGCSNATEFLNTGLDHQAGQAVVGARDAINEAMAMLRGSLVDLRRSSVEEGGLMETVRRFTDQAMVLWGTEIRIEGDIKHEPPIPVALAAFQILQEGLTNALKHAKDTSVVVRINEEDGMVHIVVEDEGPGFDPEQEIGTDHVGMRLMRERAARVGGRIELETAPGTGTRLEAILPGGVAQ